MPEPFFPPPGYYWSLNEPPTSGGEKVSVVPLLDSRVVVRDGVSILRYQLPENPVGDVVRIGGYLVSTPAGDLIDGDQKVVGTINFQTGLFEIEAALSPDLGARRVEYTFPRPAPPSLC